MEVHIGIVHSAREITFETQAKAEELRAELEQALGEGKQPLVTFTDTKGKQILVPTVSIAYVELGSDTTHKVGFVS